MSTGEDVAWVAELFTEATSSAARLTTLLRATHNSPQLPAAVELFASTLASRSAEDAAAGAEGASEVLADIDGANHVLLGHIERHGSELDSESAAALADLTSALTRMARGALERLARTIAGDVEPVLAQLPLVVPEVVVDQGPLPMVSAAAEAYVATIEDYFDEVLEVVPDVWCERLVKSLANACVMAVEDGLFSPRAVEHVDALASALSPTWMWVVTAWRDVWSLRALYAQYLSRRRAAALFDRLLLVLDCVSVGAFRASRCLPVALEAAEAPLVDDSALAAELKTRLYAAVGAWGEEFTFAHVVHVLKLMSWLPDPVRVRAQKAAFKAVVNGPPETYTRPPSRLAGLVSLGLSPARTTANNAGGAAA
ncbi:uncharacterized protein AMSG_07568 [Thecamonas trahens ATCC 50062]|uniref:Uncharacterized protein n=1 Tax=Thecamonas trahens ATCC 50062 TaxID=461836 RepID=A0A0L0DGX5_THETB|nr:hypothetical protein AMSG_07568 [Thecamonas trahens ATCC 50062]KNC51386.1 hypothetical protein AMSG_07568 [Thecamonas trahens ATCC 50062]|eukprot:XP_013756054.1 hypothetical protein AMSG_07568 [Thecamonas trahens ATCC 50062]